MEYSFINSLNRQNAVISGLNSFSNALAALNVPSHISIASSLNSFSAGISKAIPVSTVSVAKQLSSNVVSQIGTLLYSPINEYRDMDTAFDKAISTFNARHIGTVIGTAYDLQGWKAPLSAVDLIWDSFISSGEMLGRAIDNTYYGNVNIDDITEEEFESTMDTPVVKTLLSDLNAAQDPNVAMRQIFTMLVEQQTTLQEIKAKSVDGSTKKQSILLRIFLWILSLVLTQYLSPVVDNMIVKPTREALNSVRLYIQEQLQQSDPEVRDAISKKCMFTNRANVVLHLGRGEKSAPTAFLPFGSVVQVLEKHKKWCLVQYANTAEVCYIGWTQNYKLAPISPNRL